MARAPRVLHAPLEGLVPGASVQLARDVARHVVRVLRVPAGGALVLFDGEGREADARLDVRGAVAFAVLDGAPRAGVGRDGAGVTWLQGVPKGGKLESVVQKATELGVAAIWPVYTERSIPKPPREPHAKRDRWHDVAAAAAAQSGRADVPDVRDAVPLETALAALPAHASLRLVPWEQGGEPLASVLARTPDDGRGCVVLVGPEGGLAEREVGLARTCGFVAVTLGPRILRTETVAPALLAVLSYARGDLGRR